MTNGLFKKWLSAALCLAALGSTAALAEADSFYLGDGHNGALSVTTPATVINSYAQVTAPLAPKDTSITVGATTGTAFTAGSLVMVLQTTGIVPVPASGGTSAVDLSKDAVGSWELARLSAVSGTTLTLSAGLIHSYAANVTQVIRVPEYTDVTLSTAGRITATAWNGSIGGVVAFLATGMVSNGGQINAIAAGFRGGAYVNDPVATDIGCTALDVAPPTSGQKGEGIANVRYGASYGGRGNVANAGGGGSCSKSGGGGGGNDGVGGVGGRSDGSGDLGRDVGGMGGVQLLYSMVDHFTFGGGGGAGHGTDNSGGAGGKGGGLIFVRANQLSGTGSINATGGQGATATTDAGSGGGAGGTIYLRFAGTASCGSVSVAGGQGGGANTNQVGPGGGGGGGRVLFQAATGGTCPFTRNGGSPGNQNDATATGGLPYDAKAGTTGEVATLAGAFAAPAAPVVVTPADGSVTNNNRPPFTGTVTAGASVVVFIDGVEQSGPVTVDAAGLWGYTLPTGVTLSEGMHTVWAYAENLGVRGARSNTNTFTVDRTAPPAPVIVTPTQGQQVASATPVITGTAEPLSTVTVTIDGKVVGTAPVDAAGNWSFTPPTPLDAGPHEAVAVATDTAGNTSPPSTPRDFTVPADTTITSGPEGRVTDRSATFEFGPDAPGVTFECSLDGGAFVPCSSPTTYDNLADGDHTLQVRSKDSKGNVDPTPATRTWTVSPLVNFQGNGLGCSATGGDSSLVLMAVGALVTRLRRRTRR